MNDLDALERLKPLLRELLDQQLSDCQVDELRVILKESSAARRFYAEYMVTHSLIIWCSGSMPGSSAVRAESMLPEGAIQAVLPAEIRADDQSHSLPSSSEDKSQQDGKKATPILGSIGNISGVFANFPIPFVVLLAVVTTIAVVVAFVPPRAQNEPNAKAMPIAQSTSNPPEAATPVAELTGAVNCVWGNSGFEPEISSDFHVGETIRLAAGLARIKFHVGVNLLVQPPAAFTIESSNSIRLRQGKVTANVLTEEARGFKILTEDATFVDQGTEFGVEVTSVGSSKIHVFKGAVDVASNDMNGIPLPSKRLLANSGARLEGNLAGVIFVDDTGESFIRNLEDVDRDAHVVAYWRFEDHPVGTVAPNTSSNTVAIRGTVDSSYNGNDLFTHSSRTEPVFSGDVPLAIVSSSGRPNRACLDNTEPPPGGTTRSRDVYTRSIFSHASPVDAQEISPTNWTIEASVKVKSLKHVPQTFLVRDGGPMYSAAPPRLSFQVNSDDKFVIRFMDADDRVHEAIAQDFVVSAGRWYHLAAVSNARTLMLFADMLDGRGYQLVAQSSLPDSGSTALGKGKQGTEWAIGRGKVDGRPAEWFQGWIDEVRISDVALNPDEFLFSKVGAEQSL